MAAGVRCKGIISYNTSPCQGVQHKSFWHLAAGSGSACRVPGAGLAAGAGAAGGRAWVWVQGVARAGACCVGVRVCRVRYPVGVGVWACGVFGCSW